MNAVDPQYDFLVAGGGFAGTTTALLLTGITKKILLVEKKEYPVHKVCGEYISNEVLHLFHQFGIDPFEYGAASINKLSLVSPSGKSAISSLDPGGFALSRFILDKLLLDAVAKKAEVRSGISVRNATYNGKYFDIQLSDGTVTTASFVIAAHGKRDSFDRILNRKFLRHRTNYLGVKHHIRTDYPADAIGLYYFRKGYCGIVKIEEDLYNLCYLLRKPEEVTDLKEIEKEFLFKNRALKSLIDNSEFVENSDVAIHQICFDEKEKVKDHILFCGDAAGLITPLCGNGMSMAMQGAQILVHIIKKHWNPTSVTSENRNLIESGYQALWNQQFASRLSWGRRLQQYSESPFLSETVLGLMRTLPELNAFIVKQTHGRLELK